MSENVSSAVNQQGSSTFTRRSNPSETTRRSPIKKSQMEAYFQGALHDATLNKQKRFRFAQKSEAWLKMLATLLRNLGYNSWIYKEGKERNVYVLETLASFLDFTFDPSKLVAKREQVAYVRGFFDAEGGMPHNKEARFYIQLVQKDKDKILKIKKILLSMGVKTGKVHNPSKRIDPDYWRIFVSSKSEKDFVDKIGSRHPSKIRILTDRVMI